MRQTLTALLLALTLTLSLTGCTRKDNSSTDLPDNGTANNSTTNNGTVNGGTNSGDGSVGNGSDSSARSHYGNGGYARPSTTPSVFVWRSIFISSNRLKGFERIFRSASLSV